MELINGDSAIWAIMSIDILQDKVFPIFFYGASRTGSLETFVTAIFFAIGGISANVYHFSRIILLAPFILIVYLIVRRITQNEILRLLTVLWVIFPSYYFVYIAANSPGYILFLISSSLIYYIYYIIQSNKFENKNALVFYQFLFGFICGVAFWLHQLSLSFILITNLFIISQILKKFGSKKLLYFLLINLLAFFIGALPLIIYNVKHDFHNIKVILGFLFDISGKAEYDKLGILSVIKNSLIAKISGYGVGPIDRLLAMTSVILGVKKNAYGVNLWLNYAIIIN